MNYRLFIIIGCAIIISAISLSSCENEPFVSKVETVEAYNAAIDVVKEVDKNYGYNFKNIGNYANRYYKYVLIDSYVRCPVDSSADPVFKTESDSKNGPIHKNDICIDCGYRWKDHKRW